MSGDFKKTIELKEISPESAREITLSNLEILIQQEINKTYQSIEKRAKKGFDYLLKNTGHLTQSKKQKLSTYFTLKGYHCDVYDDKVKISWGRKNE